MAPLAWPTSPSSFLPAHLLLHAATSPGLQEEAAGEHEQPTKGRGPQTNAVGQAAPAVSLSAADPPVQGNGPKTNAVLEIKARGGGGAPRRPTPPAGPREGGGGRGGVIHTVADSTPQRPGEPAESAGGNGGAVHDAPVAASS